VSLRSRNNDKGQAAFCCLALTVFANLTLSWCFVCIFIPNGMKKVLPSSSWRQATVRRTGTRFVEDGFPIHFVGAIIDRPHCTAGFAGGE